MPYFIDSKMYMLPSLKSGGDIQARECSGSPGNIISFCVLHKISILDENQDRAVGKRYVSQLHQNYN